MTMQYCFDGYSLDVDAFELKNGEEAVALEPQVLSLLKLLLETPGRLVSKDQIIDAVWGGRAVSDASIANRIKLARAAIGDDGKRQDKIRTVHGQGFRFVAKVNASAPASPIMVSTGQPPIDRSDGSADDGARNLQDNKPSIAVLPFACLGGDGTNLLLAEAIPYDLIQALSCLRWLKVIARGSTFRFGSMNQDPVIVGRSLDVRYMMSGSIETRGADLVVTTELSDTRTGGIVWSEQFVSTRDGVHELRDALVTRVVASLEVHVPLNEACQARLCVSENWIPGPIIISACSTCIASQSPIMTRHRPISSTPSSKIPILPAPMPACLSPISRTPFFVTGRPEKRRSRMPIAWRSAASSWTRSIRLRILPWGGRSCCRASWSFASPGWTGRSRSIPTTPRAITPTLSPTCFRDRPTPHFPTWTRH